MATIIGMKDLRTKTEEITKRVAAGESFTVVSRSKPIFNITPTYESGGTSEVKEWTRAYVNKHRKVFESLADK